MLILAEMERVIPHSVSEVEAVETEVLGCHLPRAEALAEEMVAPDSRPQPGQPCSLVF
jgi:hypothetical protein